MIFYYNNLISLCFICARIRGRKKCTNEWKNPILNYTITVKKEVVTPADGPEVGASRWCQK